MNEHMEGGDILEQRLVCLFEIHDELVEEVELIVGLLLSWVMA